MSRSRSLPSVYNKRRSKSIPETGGYYVGRPSLFGNPFPAAIHGVPDSISMYRTWIMQPEQKYIRDKAREVLKGKDLLCWCAPSPCHADLLLIIANSDSDEEVVFPAQL